MIVESNLIALTLKRDQLWRGCVLASIAHAIMVAHYPELSHEQSWDGINYSIQDSEASRGTITFHSEYLVAAFRNDKSKRITEISKIRKAEEYFIGAPNDVLKLAKTEALQYLLSNIDGNTIPLITTAFWGTGGYIFSVDSQSEMLKNGCDLIERQLLDIKEAVDAWKDYYDMSKEQVDLLESVFKRKVAQPLGEIVLLKSEVAMIGSTEQEGLDESRASFEEIKILWEG